MDAKVRQWPDNICSGPIKYARASNYDGFTLSDADHGIPTIGSVTTTQPPTIRGAHVTVFNYPKQTEAIAAQLVERWNRHETLVDALQHALAAMTFANALPEVSAEYDFGHAIEQATAALKARSS